MLECSAYGLRNQRRQVLPIWSSATYELMSNCRSPCRHDVRNPNSSHLYHREQLSIEFFGNKQWMRSKRITHLVGQQELRWDGEDMGCRHLSQRRSFSSQQRRGSSWRSDMAMVHSKEQPPNVPSGRRLLIQQCIFHHRSKVDNNKITQKNEQIRLKAGSQNQRATMMLWSWLVVNIPNV